MRSVLGDLRRAGFLSSLDVQFAECLARLAPATEDSVVLAAALTSRQTQAGHVCLALEEFAEQSYAQALGEAHDGSFPALATWLHELECSPLVGRAGDFRPLILAERRLYLEKYWDHETRLAELISARLLPAEIEVLPDALRGTLARLFPADRTACEPGVNLQRVAVLIALLRRLSIISGGPGTGKTSTVVRLLVVLFEQARARAERAPRVLLLAPTGKAAQRLSEAVRRAKSELDCGEDIRDAIPEAASTIHRALGTSARQGARFLHDRERPLKADVVVIDEASMVDVALMRHVVEAVAAQARLVLLGDADQLASVEAGAVLGDICQAASGAYSEALAKQVEEVAGDSVPVRRNDASVVLGWHIEAELAARGPGVPHGARGSISDSVVWLKKSYRFRGDGGIGALASAIRAGDEERVARALSEPSDEVAFVHDIGDKLRDALGLWAVERYRSYLGARGAEQALHLFEGARVLSAHRKGPLGVEALNRLIEAKLEGQQLLDARRAWYVGRPVLVTQNDYTLELFNGDVGIVEAEAEGSDALRIFFQTKGGGLRAVAPSRLPSHETAFAMSIHKSQGSEFDEVSVVLPDATSPLLCRELLYTAVTRARRRVVIFGALESVLTCVRRPVRRASGLAARLAGVLLRANGNAAR